MKSHAKGKKVVIVGAGPGGLASAMLAAKAGFDVTVLERRDRVGGRTSTVEGEGGFRFDLGPTFFLYPRVLREIFHMCGRSLDREVDLIKLDPHYRLLFGGGGHLDVFPDASKMEREIARIAPEDAPRLQGYLADNREKLSAFRPILENAFNGLSDVAKLPLMKLLPLVRPLTSVDSDLSRWFQDERVRLAFTFQSKYLGMSPFNCPSLFTILSFLEYEYGVYHPRGGCGEVSSAMARVARDLGVDIRLEEPVTRILFEGRKAVGVETPQGRYRSDALTINADFAQAMTDLVPDKLRRRWTDRKLARKRYSCSTYMMYLGLDGTCDELNHHTIYLADDYRSNLADIDRQHRLSEDPSIYVQNPCVTDPELAPRGKSALYVLAPVTHMHPNIDWSREREVFRRRVIRQLDKFGLRNLERRIEFEKVITPSDWESDLHIYRGATFNLAHSLDQLLHLRPRNRFEDLDGVYLVGGGTHPGSGLPVIFESARITSKLMAEDFGLEPAWNPAEELPEFMPALAAPGNLLERAS